MISNEGDIAVTITCHLAGHRLFVAASATLKLSATTLATAAHAAVVDPRTNVREGSLRIGKELFEAIRA